MTHARPPSLSWVTHLFQGHRAYQNLVTRQETWTLPDALAWRRIDSPDHSRHFWFNFRTGTTMHEQPAELAGDTLEEALMESRAYWRHEGTGAPHAPRALGNHVCVRQTKYTWASEHVRSAAGATAWEHPEPQPWRVVKHKETNYNYYYHSETGDAVWHPPDEFAWKQTLSTEHEKHYWFNSKTGEASWDPPAHFAWRRHELGTFMASHAAEL